MTVTVQFDGDTTPTTFLLAQRGIADGGAQTDLDVYPPTAPLGMAIFGKFPEDRFVFHEKARKRTGAKAVRFGGADDDSAADIHRVVDDVHASSLDVDIPGA